MTNDETRDVHSEMELARQMARAAVAAEKSEPAWIQAARRRALLRWLDDE